MIPPSINFLFCLKCSSFKLLTLTFNSLIYKFRSLNLRSQNLKTHVPYSLHLRCTGSSILLKLGEQPVHKWFLFLRIYPHVIVRKIKRIQRILAWERNDPLKLSLRTNENSTSKPRPKIKFLNRTLQYF